MRAMAGIYWSSGGQDIRRKRAAFDGAIVPLEECALRAEILRVPRSGGPGYRTGHRTIGRTECIYIYSRWTAGPSEWNQWV